MQKYSVNKQDANLTLQKWLKLNVKQAPFTLLQKFLRKKLVKVNGKRGSKDLVLNAGDEVIIPSVEIDTEKKQKEPPKISSAEIEEHLIQNIIYQNDKVLVINKPKGIPSQGGSKVRISVDVMLKNMEDEWGFKTHIVHRLDKDTTGILIIAKDRETAQILGEKFKNREIEKTYIAICVGKLVPKVGVIDKKIGKNTAIQEKMQVDEYGGKPSVTTYSVIEHYGKVASLVEVMPETGRKHQIRVHLSSIGFPILGDGKYGGKAAFIEGISNKLHLHAWKLGKISGIIDEEIEILPPFNTDNLV